VLLLLIAFGTTFATFRTGANINNILNQSIVLGLVAIGQAVVMIGGGLDMSVGAITGVLVLVGAITMDGKDSSLAWTVPLLCVIGIGFGFVNGAIITWLRAAPFIVTFATYFLLVGLANAISTTPVGAAAPTLISFYGLRWGGISAPAILMAVIWAVSWLFLRATASGRHVFAVGGRVDVAERAGIRTRRVVVGSYAVSGLFAALAAVVTLSIGGIGDPQAGVNLQFLSITAAAVGGVSLLGGRGSLIGVLGGVLLLTVVNDLLQIAQIDTFYQQPIQGVIIIAAVAFYRNRKLQD
jgi:ribose/xylose/arabinose/galactoside ABC-type transport system permease subunit